MVIEGKRTHESEREMKLQEWMKEAIAELGGEDVEMVGNVPSNYGIQQPIIRAEFGGSVYYGAWEDGIHQSDIEWCDTEEEAVASLDPWCNEREEFDYAA